MSNHQANDGDCFTITVHVTSEVVSASAKSAAMIQLMHYLGRYPHAWDASIQCKGEGEAGMHLHINPAITGAGGEA